MKRFRFFRGVLNDGKMTDAPAVWEVLRRAKERAGESNRSLAEKSGVPETTVAKIMCGAAPNPTFAQVAAMAPVLALDLNVLAGLEPPPVDADAAVAVARLEGANLLADGLRERIALYERGVHQRNLAICVLLGLSGFFSVAFMFYVILDLQNPQYGLFRGADPQWGYVVAVVPVLLVLLAGHLLASRRTRGAGRKIKPVSNLDTGKNERESTL